MHAPLSHISRVCTQGRGSLVAIVTNTAGAGGGGSGSGGAGGVGGALLAKYSVAIIGGSCGKYGCVANGTVTETGSFTASKAGYSILPGVSAWDQTGVRHARNAIGRNATLRPMVASSIHTYLPTCLHGCG